MSRREDGLGGGGSSLVTVISQGEVNPLGPVGFVLSSDGVTPGGVWVPAPPSALVTAGFQGEVAPLGVPLALLSSDGATAGGVWSLFTDALHGIRGGGTQHAAATPVVAGFMSGADKLKLDGIASGAASCLLIFGASALSATTTTRFLFPTYEDALAPTAAIQYRVSRAGTLRNLRVRHNTTAGNGNAIIYTLRVNGVASLLTVSLASTAADASDLVNTVVVAAGDLVDVRATKALNIASSPTGVVAEMEMAA